MLHPDTKYETLLSMQQERLQKAIIETQIVGSRQAFTWRERMLLKSGELLITVGTSLKHQVEVPVCAAEAA